MAASFDARWSWTIVGLSMMIERKSVRAQCVADIANATLEGLSQRQRDRVLARIDSVLVDRRRAVDDRVPLKERDKVESALCGALELSFTGPDFAAFAVIGKNEFGRALETGLVNAILDRVGMTDPAVYSNAQRSYARGLLHSGLKACDRISRVKLELRAWPEEMMEDEELDPPEESPVQDASVQDGEDLRGALERDGEGFLEEHPEATLDMTAHLRGRVPEISSEMAQLSKKILGAFTKVLADPSLDGIADRHNRRNELEDQLKRRPLASRVERLMFSAPDETFLLALELRFQTVSPTGGPKALAVFLRAGVELRDELIHRMRSLGTASRSAGLHAGVALGLAEFDFVEKVIGEVKARKAERPFLTPGAMVEGRRNSPRFETNFVGPGPNPFERPYLCDLERATADGPVRRARALAVNGRRLAESGKEAPALEQAIDCWREAMTVWTRSEHPRKWAALSQNIGVVQEALARRPRGGRDRARLEAAHGAIMSALDALDPVRDAWTWVSAHTARLSVERKLRWPG